MNSGWRFLNVTGNILKQLLLPARKLLPSPANYWLKHKQLKRLQPNILNLITAYYVLPPLIRKPAMYYHRLLSVFRRNILMLVYIFTKVRLLKFMTRYYQGKWIWLLLPKHNIYLMMWFCSLVIVGIVR